ncbi:ABC-2 type transport system ATP-binding protein [Clostridium acetobutylicum]|uniref:ABC transporter (ATP-binding protein) n=1 Tax=Clostridium acetobutylicum (strain ATCC 824 / DSM 792 / JCM 1419 / IAM 19013 / LMG 5710 / NBRC 13948 / NRRL B-527 / VKM B-1787 / 2291 / W) TaxID=272562 RepID=Q97MM6_CLOAB|nr:MULTISPECIES: ABC transporter ATP-binding protein [Clostridium]AAK78152.1 ABC transporter (ATP-binding protein) [Clostridium acetobutylicum ATCC 824]ADZ19214.1 ABC transporter (ATP-binding protein) [Clostridium acetobutylicum EA 2018]AEI31092.1 ABC transporter ATP-binding protein [Clostridium acetobutylicum DSM 1731]AWV81958.1 ABC transporter ATP-binding protein [Clostridium acetobutylicum]MBC2395974.1 ABC transporter ATP-binding protein [Clostridium acetobutylicum]
MLELTNITKKYGDFTAVNNISFKIEDGEVFGLLGPNGAGKSTIVSMISTVISPTSGDITVDNKLLRQKPTEIKKVMGIVPQDIALYESLSAKDNLEFFGCLYGLNGKELKERVNEVLKIIELEDKKDQAVEEFSGGMKRRVNIGVALMNNPKLLILDEPTVGIDPQSRNHILETVKKLNKERGMTVIYTSHYMEEVEYLCKRIAIVDHGKLIALGTKDELKEKSKAKDTLTVIYSNGDKGALDKIKSINGIENVSISNNQISMLVDQHKRNIIDIVEDVRNLGVKLTSFKYEEVNLESIFLQITGKSLRD